MPATAVVTVRAVRFGLSCTACGAAGQMARDTAALWLLAHRQPRLDWVELRLNDGPAHRWGRIGARPRLYPRVFA